MIEQILPELLLELNTMVIPRVIDLLVFFAPVFVPIILLNILWPKWINYVRTRWILSQEYCLLEFKIPVDNLRSPAAMELALHALHKPLGDGTWFDRYWHGKTLPWFSLEIVSLEGQVKFFIWTRKDSVKSIEASFYSQFPNIEIRQVEDYTKSFHYKKGETDVWAAELKLTKEDPYPIKTYVDYGLDKDPKEEFKIDPITPLIEYLGTVGIDQQIWIQILIKGHRKDANKAGFHFAKTDELKDKAKKLINEIRSRDEKTRLPVADKDSKQKIDLSEGEKDVVYAIERAMKKLQFDVVIRTTYVAKKDKYDGGNIGGILGSFKQFGSEDLNGIAPNTSKLMMQFASPFSDFLGMRKDFMKGYSVNISKLRGGFFIYPSSTPFVLNIEELATIFHFPGRVSQTPSFERILSKKGEPPANLPI